MNMIARGRKTVYSVTGTSVIFVCPVCGKAKSSSARRGFGGILFCTCRSRKEDVPVRRKNPRRDVCLIGSMNYGKKGSVIIENISLGGVAISANWVDSILCVGDEVSIGFFSKGEEVNIKAIVRNVRNMHIGLEFDRHSIEARMCIYSIITSDSRAAIC